MDFDFDTMRFVEFGVGRDEHDDQTFHSMTVDGDVQGALAEMAIATHEAMTAVSPQPAQYEPADKHGSAEHMFLPLTEEAVRLLRDLHRAAALPPDNDALADPADVFCYFARFEDRRGRKLTAIRRASQFKGILKSRLIRLVTDALKIIEDRVFKLDKDYDVLIDNANVYILRPSSFEYMCRLQKAMLEAVPDNITAIKAQLGFVDFGSIARYACNHSRAARCLASIRTQPLQGISQDSLKKYCQGTGVIITTENGQLKVDDENVMSFLEVLDRRRYEVPLITNSPEVFRAASRTKLER